MSIVESIRKKLGRDYERYKTVFGSSMGEEVLSDLMSFTNFNAELFTPGSPDQTAYNLGMRRVVLYILTQARATPQDIDRIARIVQSQQQDKLWEEEI